MADKLLPDIKAAVLYLNINELSFVVLFLYIKQRHLGIQVLTYGFVYCLLRFSLEFLRGDKERGALLGMSTSQFISLIFAAVLIAIIIVRVKKSKKQVAK
jgi:prolipoprotein diacylglyceryltransferase